MTVLEERILILDALDSDGASYVERPFLQETSSHHLGHKWKQFWSRGETDENESGNHESTLSVKKDLSNASTSIMQKRVEPQHQKVSESKVPSFAPTFRIFQDAAPAQEQHRKRFKRNSRMLVVDHRYDPISKANSVDIDSDTPSIANMDPRIQADMEKQRELQAKRSAEAKAERDAIARNRELKRQAALKKKAQREEKRRAASEIQQQRADFRKAESDKRLEADRKKQTELEAKQRAARQMTRYASGAADDTTLSRKQQKALDDEKWNELRTLRTAQRKATADRRKASRQEARLVDQAPKAPDEALESGEGDTGEANVSEVADTSVLETVTENESTQSTHETRSTEEVSQQESETEQKAHAHRSSEKVTYPAYNYVQSIEEENDHVEEMKIKDEVVSDQEEEAEQGLGDESNSLDLEPLTSTAFQGTEILTGRNEAGDYRSEENMTNSSFFPRIAGHSQQNDWILLLAVALVVLFIIRSLFERKKRKPETVSRSFDVPERKCESAFGPKYAGIAPQEEEVHFMLHIISFDAVTFLAGEVLTCWEPFTMDEVTSRPPDTLLIEESQEDTLEMSDEENEISSLAADPSRKVSVHVHYLLVNYLNGLLRHNKLQRRRIQIVADEQTNSTSYQIVGLGSEMMREISQELREMGVGSKIGVLYATPLKIMKMPSLDEELKVLDAPQTLIETHPHSTPMSGEGSVASLAEYTVDSCQQSSIASESGKTVGSTAAVASENEQSEPLLVREFANNLNSSYEDRVAIQTIDRSITPVRSNIRQNGYGPDHPRGKVLFNDRSVASNPQSPSISESEQEIVFSSNQSVGESIAGSVGNKSTNSNGTYLYGEHWINSRHLCMPRDEDEESDPALVMGRREPQKPPMPSRK